MKRTFIILIAIMFIFSGCNGTKQMITPAPQQPPQQLEENSNNNADEKEEEPAEFYRAIGTHALGNLLYRQGFKASIPPLVWKFMEKNNT